MNIFKIIENLKLRTYVYNENEKSFVHLEKNDTKNINLYDYTAEIIKLVRYLKINHIDFEEDIKGNIKLIA